jgi:fatty-acyl-CoA synthase
MDNQVVGEVLRRTAARGPERVAVIADGGRMSYGALDRAADRFANALLAQGLGKGHVVAILSTNRLEYPVYFFGAARAGVLQAHLSTRYTANDLRDVMGRAGIEAVFVHAEFLSTILEVRADLPALKTIVVFGGPAKGKGVVSLDDFLEGAPETPPAAKVDPEDPLAITFTGGTTGFPKGVLVTHRARWISGEMAWQVFGLSEDDVILLATPLFHVAGLFSWFATGMYGGVTFVLLPHWDPVACVDLIARERVTAACMVPTQINTLFADTVFDADKLATLHYLNYGGSAMPAPVLKRVVEKKPGITMFEHYGQSEVGPICYRPPELALSKPTSVGYPFSEVELAIFDGGGQRLPQGSTGEIVVRSPILFREYYRDPEQTAAAFLPDGWLKTGDLGFIDPDGCLVLVDRSKDLIISGGENIYPVEIENALYRHEAVAEAAVFGIPDDKWGEVPAAHVVLKPGKRVTEAALIDFVAQSIARHKRPRIVKFVEELPKTAVGKIRKNLIRADYWQGRDRAI